MRMLLALSVFPLIAGCAYLSPPAENPIIEQHARERINTFAVVPARRMMIVKSDKYDDKNSDITICAEAPSDVTDNIASTFAASLAAAAKTGGEVSAGMTRTLETFGQLLFKRSQGIQLFRDRSFYLCQARMNGFITKDQYQERLDKAFSEVIPLIEKEINTNAFANPAAQAASQARVQPTSLNSKTTRSSVQIGKDGEIKAETHPASAAAAPASAAQ